MKKPTLNLTQKQQFPQHFPLVYTVHFSCINERFGSAVDKIRDRKNTKSVRCEIIAFLGHAWFNTALQLDFFYSSLLRESASHGVQFILFSVPWRFSFPYLKTLLFRAFFSLFVVNTRILSLFRHSFCCSLILQRCLTFLGSTAKVCELGNSKCFSRGAPACKEACLIFLGVWSFWFIIKDEFLMHPRCSYQI